MDPSLLVPAQWDQIRLLVNDAFLMAGLIIVAGGSFLVAHAVVPSLLATREAPPALGRLRPVFYLVFWVALVLGLYAMARMFHLAVALLGDFYPRFGY